jgi:hypothetical protein
MSNKVYIVEYQYGYDYESDFQFVLLVTMDKNKARKFAIQKAKELYEEYKEFKRLNYTLFERTVAKDEVCFEGQRGDFNMIAIGEFELDKEIEIQ